MSYLYTGKINKTVQYFFFTTLIALLSLVTSAKKLVGQIHPSSHHFFKWNRIYDGFNANRTYTLVLSDELCTDHCHDLIPSSSEKLLAPELIFHLRSRQREFQFEVISSKIATPKILVFLNKPDKKIIVEPQIIDKKYKVVFNENDSRLQSISIQPADAKGFENSSIKVYD